MILEAGKFKSRNTGILLVFGESLMMLGLTAEGQVDAFERM